MLLCLSLLSSSLFAYEVPVSDVIEWSGVYEVVSCEYCPNILSPRSEINYKNLVRIAIGEPDHYKKPQIGTGHTYNMLWSMSWKSEDGNNGASLFAWMRSGFKEVSEVGRDRFYWDLSYYNLKRRVFELQRLQTGDFEFNFYSDDSESPEPGEPVVLQYKATVRRVTES
jgi:hypothetical protein